MPNQQTTPQRQKQTDMSGLYHISFHTELGWMRPISDGSALIRLDWDQAKWDEVDHPDDVSRETMRQLQEYLGKTRHVFHLPLSPEGKNMAARRWLDVMATIPYGAVWTYKEFAAAASMPKAARAAGTACSSNPIPIIYPCHRVVKSDGSLGNYGGGSDDSPQHPANLGRKQTLIDLERVT